METETIDKLYLELSQVTNAISDREIMLLEFYDEIIHRYGGFKNLPYGPIYSKAQEIKQTYKEWFHEREKKESFPIPVCEKVLFNWEVYTPHPYRKVFVKDRNGCVLLCSHCRCDMIYEPFSEDKNPNLYIISCVKCGREECLMSDRFGNAEWQVTQHPEYKALKEYRNHEKRDDAPEANENTRSDDRRDSHPKP